MSVNINADTTNGLVLTSDTSGEIKLQSAGADIATVTSSGITMASGKGLAATGHVLQTVVAKNTTQITTTSTSYVSTGISASITPSSTSSKIIVSVVPNGVYATQIAIWFTLYRNGTDVSGSLNELVQLYSSSGNVLSSVPFIYYDSPNSTSAQTYTLYWKVSGSTGTINYAGVSGETIIMLQEVAG